MSQSNNNGRVLEYLIVVKIKERFGSKVSLSKNTIKDQKRDIEKLSGIDPKVFKNMEISSVKISEWLKHIFKEKSIEVHRLKDGEGVKGDVTDIRITDEQEVLNLSIKHNHEALKHQRPGPTPQHLNFEKKSEVDTEFRTKFENVFDEFRKSSLKIKPNIVKYKEIEHHIPELLYFPMCTLVSKFINEHGNEGERANHYLKFLVGNTEFKKIIVFPDSNILIQSYDNIPVSKLVTTSVINNSYIEVDFHNGIILLMRLHTASSRFSENSLKFDTQRKEFEVPELKL